MRQQDFPCAYVCVRFFFINFLPLLYCRCVFFFISTSREWRRGFALPLYAPWASSSVDVSQPFGARARESGWGGEPQRSSPTPPAPPSSTPPRDPSIDSRARTRLLSLHTGASASSPPAAVAERVAHTTVGDTPFSYEHLRLADLIFAKTTTTTIAPHARHARPSPTADPRLVPNAPALSRLA